MVLQEVPLICMGVNFKENSPTHFENEDQILGLCTLILIQLLLSLISQLRYNGLPVSWSVIIQLSVYFEVLKSIFARICCYFGQNNILAICFTHTVRALGHIDVLYFPELSN